MFKEIKSDLPASIVVFFVALPLCLGIALASGAPLFSGIIAGIVGGIIVGAASGSPLGVSGPAAGLAVIVFSAIETLGSFQAFLMAVVIAGAFQLILGFARAGFIAHFFPSSVIKGMLTGIGLLIILKQIPHALGYDNDYHGDMSFWQLNGENTLSSISSALNAITAAAVIISLSSLFILVFWEKVLAPKHKAFRLIQGPLVVILFGILMNYLFINGFINLSLSPEQVVNIPVPQDFMGFLSQFSTPDFSYISSLEVWKIAAVLAIVASLETLLCVEATDKLDPYRRITPTNRELKAQGLGNIASGLIGGLPLTQVIVRSSANIAFGGRTKLSGILHGFFLLLSAMFITKLLNLIPLACLAAILLIVGYKLAKPELFKKMYHLGWQEFVPFTMTVVGILATDLLIGITIGVGFGILTTLWNDYRNTVSVQKAPANGKEGPISTVKLPEVVTFFHKARILQVLEEIEAGESVVIDGSSANSISHDIIEIINNFASQCEFKKIKLTKINI